MRIVLASRVAQKPIIERLATVDGIELQIFPSLADAMPALHEADALILSDPRGAEGAAVAAELRRPDNRVQWIQFVTAGGEGLLAHEFPKTIRTTNQGGAVAPAVAEHGIALMLAMARRLDAIRANMTTQTWDKHFSPPVFSVENKTLCIVGMGHIGRQLAIRARAFGMRIVGVSRSGAPDDLADEVLPMSQLSQGLGQADVVAVCVASSAETRHLMNAETFAACRKGALFLNLSRGETVDGAALQAALESGHLRAAAIDVTDPEPLPAGHPLWNAPNLIISPHTAGAGSTQTGVRIANVVAENIDRFRSGQQLKAEMSRAASAG